MKLRQRIVASAWAGSLWVFSACGSQAGPSYPGESLVNVSGVVVSELTTDSTPDAVVLVNWGELGAMFPPGGDMADVSGSFPAKFTLALYEPPSEAMLYNPANDIALGTGAPPFDAALDSRIAMGRIIAVTKGADGKPEPYHVIGGAEQHALVYVEHDMQSNSYGARLFHAPLSAGFHLIDIRARSNADNQPILDCEVAATSNAEWVDCGLNSVLYPASAQAEVSVRLVDDEGQLNFPSMYPVYLPPGWQPPPPIECGGPMDPCMMP
jgi:hypothetical protein